MIRFPENFLWGAATAAYQVEGGNSNSDWWPWEIRAGKERSGNACRHYQLYEQDFDLAKSLNHNAHRLSIEWARIEPEEGKFSEEELRHYEDVLRALRARGLEPVVTLHHFTNPVWFSASGGWERPDAPLRFLRYVDAAVRRLAPFVRYWITINEPMIYMTHSYMLGVWPPQKTSLLSGLAVERRLVRAHVEAYRRIHAIYRELGLPAPAVSLSKHMQAFNVCAPSLRNRIAAWLRDRWFNMGFLDAAARHGTLDFIGINYYSRQLVDLAGWLPRNFAADVCRNNHFPAKKNSLGWDIYPEGLYQVLMKLKKYRLPVMITENGICTSDDDLRWEFIAGHLASVRRAMDEGLNVTGYLYWSLLDNFEWDKGFGPRFGLVDIDYSTCTRTVRRSAMKLAAVAKTGVLEA